MSMRKLVNIIYIVMAFIGLLRVPGLLLRKKTRRVREIGQLIPHSLYLIIRDKRVREYYVITDIYSDYRCGFTLRMLLQKESDKLYMIHSNAKLQTIHSGNPFLYETCVHFVKLVDLPRDVLKFVHRKWLASAVSFQAKACGYNIHYPSDEDRDRLLAGQKIFDDGIKSQCLYPGR